MMNQTPNYHIMFDALHEQHRTSTAEIVLEMARRCRFKPTMQEAGHQRHLL
jgi:hypothetical protein